MTLTAISNTIARAILSTIERDGICNLQNIEEAVFRELAVAEARRPAPLAAASDDAIRRCAEKLAELLLEHAMKRPSGYYTHEIAEAHHNLSKALNK